MKKLHYILVLLAASVSCQRIEVVDPAETGARIRMWASMPASASLTSSVTKASGPSGMSEDNAFYYYNPSQARTRATETGPGNVNNIISSDTDLGDGNHIGMMRIDYGYHDLYPRFAYSDNDYSQQRKPSEPLLAELGAPDPGNAYLREIGFVDDAQFFRNMNNDVKYAAWYPWRADWNEASDTEGYDFTTGADGTTVRLPINGSTDVLYGNVATGSQARGFNVMDFNHALCIYRIYAYAMSVEMEDGDEMNTAKTWGPLEQITLEDVPKYVFLTLPNQEETNHNAYDRYTIDYSYYEGGEGVKKEDFVYDLNISSDQDNMFFNNGVDPETGELPIGISNRRLVAICIAPPPPENVGVLNMGVKTEHAESVQKISIARNFKAGHAYDVVLRFSAHGIINSSVMVGSWQMEKDDVSTGTSSIFYNMSRYGTSNCYEINSGNYNYCFDGTVKGNGNAPLGVTDTSLDPKYVDILWTDIENVAFKDEDGQMTSEKPMVEMVSNYLSDGKVLIHVNGDYTDSDISKTPLKKEGNVILAAYDTDLGAPGASREDARILWTWHLWLTDAVDDVGNNNGIIIQDRNLGATSSFPKTGGERDLDMHGLYYQWGRPTPFNLKDYSVTGGDLKTAADGISIPNSTAKARYSASSAATVQDAISNPMTIYGVDEDVVDWVAVNNSGEFTKRHFVSLWGWSSNYSDAVKTMYDPCPYGYRVPGYRLWPGISLFRESYDDDSGAVLYFGGSNETRYFYLPSTGYFSSDGLYLGGQSYITWSQAHVGETDENRDDIYALWYRNTDDNKGEAGIYESPSSTELLQVRCISRRVRSVVTDLSASQTANSYMISSPGYYKFKATTRGNGLGSLLPIGGSSTVEINYGVTPEIDPSEIVCIKPLWWQGDMSSASFSTDTPANALSFAPLVGDTIDSEGYYVFYVDELKEGNLVLAAYNPDGEILWTWHLWFTDKPADKRSGNYALMDRFLGATHAPEISGNKVRFDSEGERLATYGFYYQWGRKDPIVGAPEDMDSGDETGTETGGTSGSSRYFVYDRVSDAWETRPRTSIEIDGSRPEVPVVVKNPMKFYSTASEYGDNSHWMTESAVDGRTNPAMWGYAVEGYDTGQSYSKTMWDPCPPGYRTPLHHVWYYSDDYCYADAEGTGKYGISAEQGYDEVNGADGTEKGIVTKKTNTATGLEIFDEVWYPYAGYRSPTSGRYTDVGQNGFMLSGMPMGRNNMRSFFWYGNNDYGFKDMSGQACDQQSTSRGPAFGMPVRCQKE